MVVVCTRMADQRLWRFTLGCIEVGCISVSNWCWIFCLHAENESKWSPMDTTYIQWLPSILPLPQRMKILLVYMSCITVFILTKCCVHIRPLCSHNTLFCFPTWIPCAAGGNYYSIDQFWTSCLLLYPSHFLHFFLLSITIVICLLYICNTNFAFSSTSKYAHTFFAASYALFIAF